jgi:hypothetical protein
MRAALFIKMTQIAQTRVWKAAAVGALLVVIHSAAARAGDALSIPQLLDQRSKWSDFATKGTPIKVEGRYANFSPKLLRFAKCEDLNFVWHDEEQSFPLEQASLRSRTIEVYGRFVMQLGKPLFRVDGLRELPPDDETLRVRRSAIRDAPAAAWYALGDWALARGAFYSEVDLENESRQLFAEGIQRELRSLSDDALEAKIRLSEKFRKYGLPDSDRNAFLHDALSHRWLGTKRNASAAELAQLCDQMAENLRQCQTPLEAPEPALSERYDRDPSAFYRDSGTGTRLKLNRILYSEVRYAYVLALARQKNLDGLQHADAIDREVPEFHAEADKLRETTLDERLAAAGTLSRSDVLKLAELFTQRGQPEKAMQAKKAWVLAGDERLRKEGRPDDLIQAAREHQTLLEDNEGAAKLLMEAYEHAPAMKEISEQLNRLRYTRTAGRWLTRAEAAALPPDPSKEATEGGPRVGMSREQMQKVLASRPDSVTRVVSAGQLNEVWIYETGGSRLAVHFLGSIDGHDLKVVKLVQ